jgi:hypothetical protein
MLSFCLQVIRTNSSLRKPAGILWHKLSPQKLGQIRVLQQLKRRIEEETGQPLPTGAWLRGGLASCVFSLRRCNPMSQQQQLLQLL